MPEHAAATILEHAPAKLNLDLLVTGRTATGYHELDSIVVFADVADRLTFTPAAALELRLEGPFAASLATASADLDDNLVLRAARRLGAAAGLEPAVRITLEKNLPVASGIGGGSADAAATLRGLARLWDLDWPAESLREVGLGLGADVPVCVYGRPARLRGIGERLDPVRGLPDLPLVLVNPGVAVATAAVFEAFELPTMAVRRPVLPAQPSLARFAVWLEASRNELEPAARALAPAIGEVLDRLRSIEDCVVARMSGSGATCFGLFTDAGKAAAAAATLDASATDWWCRACIASGSFR